MLSSSNFILGQQTALQQSSLAAALFSKVSRNTAFAFFAVFLYLKPVC